MDKYPWYKVVSVGEQLLQGDFINACPVVVPHQQIALKKVNAHVLEYNVVIMSQSCDLIQKKLDLVLVSPFWPLNEFENQNHFFKSQKGKETLRRGNIPGYHLLNKCELNGFKTDYLVVDFRSIYSVPFDFLLNLIQQRGDRIRLLPPYREHLSQSFARFFMRVGLPVDISPFK